jgi:hypothetical protein
MSKRAVEEGAAGKSWSHAMEAMVNCYREGIAISREQQAMALNVIPRPRLRISRYLMLMFFIVTLLLGITYWALLRS